MDVFISTPFKPEFDWVTTAISQTASERSLTTYRVDRDNFVNPIVAEIEMNIRASRILVADITDSNPNVLHEIGLAQMLGKPIVLISQHDPNLAPFNIRGLPIHSYRSGDVVGLKAMISACIASASSPNEILRSMLVPASLGQPDMHSRFVIAASPLSYRRATGRDDGYKKIRRSYSDYYGIRSILQGFGLLYGFNILPDLINPEDHDDVALDESMNLYCIASPKANRWTDLVMQQYREHYVPCMEFKADPGSQNLKNVNISIMKNNSPFAPSDYTPDTLHDRYGYDFGIILRGPKIGDIARMVTVLAGRASLGTEAACRAFTDTKVISQIRDRLSGILINEAKIEIENHLQGFIALVSMQRTLKDGREEAIPTTLQLHHVEALIPRRRTQ